jgi:hypothetical protein
MKIELGIYDQTLHVNDSLHTTCSSLQELLKEMQTPGIDDETLRRVVKTMSADPTIIQGLKTLLDASSKSVNYVQLIGAPDEELDEGQMLIVTPICSFVVDAKEMRRAARCFEEE